MKHKRMNEEELVHLLNQQGPIPIDQQHKKHVAATVKAYMPISQPSAKMVFRHLFKQAMGEMWHRQKLALSTLFILLLCFYMILPDSSDKTLLFLVTTPAPLLLIGWSMLEDQREDMMELLLTYKFTFQQLLCAKIAAVCCTAFACYTLLGLYLAITIEKDVWLSTLQLLITGITPILVWSLALLVLHIKYRSSSLWMVLSMIWLLFAMLAVYTPVGEMIVAIDLVFFFIVNILLILLLCKAIHYVWRLERVAID